MLRHIWIMGTVLIALASCTEQQVREMAQVGTKDGKPVYRITTRVRLPASEEKIKQLQESSIEAQGKRLCPQGYHEIGRAEPYEDEYYYNTYPYAYGWGGIWDLNTYFVLKQDIDVMCNS